MTTKKQDFQLFIESNKKNYTTIGSFKNEYGEEFAIYVYNKRPSYLYMTGDELNWETKKMWGQGREVGKLIGKTDKNFVLSIDELIMALRVLNKYVKGESKYNLRDSVLQQLVRSKDLILRVFGRK